MYPSTAISYELAQSKIADLRRQARRASAARNAQASAAQAEPRVVSRFRIHRRRVTAALG